MNSAFNLAEKKKMGMDKNRTDRNNADKNRDG